MDKIEAGIIQPNSSNGFVLIKSVTLTIKFPPDRVRYARRGEDGILAATIPRAERPGRSVHEIKKKAVCMRGYVVAAFD